MTTYERTAEGNVAPIRTLAGPQTGLSNPESVAVDTVDDAVVVASTDFNSICDADLNNDGVVDFVDLATAQH